MEASWEYDRTRSDYGMRYGSFAATTCLALALEVPREHAGHNILEIGNVMSHCTAHGLVVAEYLAPA